MKVSGITKLSQLQDLINKHLESAMKVESKIIATLGKDGVTERNEVSAKVSGKVYFSDKSRLERGFFFSHAGLLRKMLLTREN